MLLNIKNNCLHCLQTFSLYFLFSKECRIVKISQQSHWPTIIDIFTGQHIFNLKKCDTSKGEQSCMKWKKGPGIQSTKWFRALGIASTQVPPADLANGFASYFYDKVKTYSAKTVIINAVYNGNCKLIVQNRNFMILNL